MSRKNCILEGKYKGIKITKDIVLRISNDIEPEGYPLSKYSISSYEVINEATVSQFSGWKALMGISALGSLGMALGIDGENDKEYLISIEWKLGGKSLILLEYDYYKTFIQAMF